MTYQREYIPPKAKLLPPAAKKVFTGEIFEVYQWPQEMYDGSMATFEMLRRADTVEVIGIKDNKIVITRQTQPRQDLFYAYPGGRVDETDENELAAAKREMREETGMEFRHWKLISVHQPQAKIDWLVYLFVAWDFAQQNPQTLDSGERIEVLEVAFDELKEYAKLPNAKYLSPACLDGIDNVNALKAMPALHLYH